jgi:hypothetical protein
MRLFHFALPCLILSLGSAIAQDQPKEHFNPFPPKDRCWEIYVSKEAAPYLPILLNKCDGTSWILTKNPITDKQGRATGSWIWRWSPLGSEKDEAILSLPNGSQYLTTPNR